ncbi:MAG: DNA-3-methyladenine glycosylase [Alphaproteobacteria bacterium]|nr:DNA-3-methyladenine glycosylase [Alphaproteobacteria bacterium]
MSRLGRAFFARDVLDVAPALVGMQVGHGAVRLRITEVEAYRWPGDTACHARHGRTPRTEALFGPPGTAYVYLCYGLHQMLNIVTGEEGSAQAVLVRSAEIVDGHALVAERRGGRTGPDALAGPGKVGQALGIDTRATGQPFYEPGGIELFAGTPADALVRGPRVGIDYAEAAHRALPWRWADAGSRAVSHRKKLE